MIHRQAHLTHIPPNVRYNIYQVLKVHFPAENILIGFDRQTNRQTDGQVDGRKDRQTDGQTDRETLGGQTDGQKQIKVPPFVVTEEKVM